MRSRFIQTVACLALLAALPGCQSKEYTREQLLAIQDDRIAQTQKCLPALRDLQKDLRNRKAKKEDLGAASLTRLPSYEAAQKVCPPIEVYPGQYSIVARTTLVPETPLECTLLLNQYLGLEDSCSPKEVPAVED